MTIDMQKLEDFRTQTTVSGAYLEAWNAFERYSHTQDYQIDLKNYLITFQEDEESILIFFTAPRSDLVLGGGNGKCIINKSSMTVESCSFAK